jgi:hypothetical protein
LIYDLFLDVCPVGQEAVANDVAGLAAVMPVEVTIVNGEATTCLTRGILAGGLSFGAIYIQLDDSVLESGPIPFLSSTGHAHAPVIA